MQRSSVHNDEGMMKPGREEGGGGGGEGKTFAFHLGESYCRVANQHLPERCTISDSWDS